MHNHQPLNYRCPFCLIACGEIPADVATQPQDIIQQSSMVTAFIASHWWPNNPGHVIIIPNQHYENIYDLPADGATAIHNMARTVAIAMKAAYKCGGISTRQHNEPDGDQEIWHYHLHVFPRYADDRLYQSTRRVTTHDERQIYAQILRHALNAADG